MSQQIYGQLWQSFEHHIKINPFSTWLEEGRKETRSTTVIQFSYSDLNWHFFLFYPTYFYLNEAVLSEMLQSGLDPACIMEGICFGIDPKDKLGNSKYITAKFKFTIFIGDHKLGESEVFEKNFSADQPNSGRHCVELVNALCKVDQQILEMLGNTVTIKVDVSILTSKTAEAS